MFYRRNARKKKKKKRAKALMSSEIAEMNAMADLVFVLIKNGVMSEYLYHAIMGEGIEHIVETYVIDLWESSTIAANVMTHIKPHAVKRVMELLQRDDIVWGLITEYSGG